MVNSLLAPTAVIGLMGAQRRQNSLLPFPIQADPLDEMMFQRAPNGYVEGAGGQYFAADRSGQTPMQQQAPATPQRDRVSGWRVLDRVLGGQTITEGLDAERARLQAQAMQPQQQARIQAVLNNLSDPREQALFLGLGGEDWLKATGARFTPQVVGAGASQAINGMRTVEQPSFTESGDTTLARTSAGVNPVYTRTAPSIAEQTAIDKLAWDQQYGQSRLGIDQYQAQTGRMNAETTAGSAGFTLGNDQTRYDPSGNKIATAAASAGPTPESLANARAAIANTRRAITDARDQVNWRTTGQLANLIPFNQGKEDLQRTADTIEANLSFNALQQMRDASKTGGALGSIAVRELELLGSTIASLKTSQSPEQFRKNLDVIDASLNRWEQALSQGQGSGNTPPPPAGFVLD